MTDTTEYYGGMPAAAAFLGCCQRTIFRLIASGQFPPHDIEITMVGSKLRVWRGETLESYRKNLRPRGNPRLLGNTEGQPK